MFAYGSKMDVPDRFCGFNIRVCLRKGWVSGVAKSKGRPTHHSIHIGLMEPQLMKGNDACNLYGGEVFCGDD